MGSIPSAGPYASGQAAPPVVGPPSVDLMTAVAWAALADSSAPAVASAVVNVYAGTTHGLDPRVAGITPRVYVPDEKAGTVVVIDPTTFRIIARYHVGLLPHHVTPSWDLRTLYVNDMESSRLTEIDPVTGRPTGSMAIPSPYNLYFTPDGSKAIVVAEPLNRLDFYDRRTWRLLKHVPIPYAGPNHLDFSANGRYLIVSTEFAGYLVRVDTVHMRISGDLHVGGQPIDVKLSPDGTVFYNANMARGGVSIVDPVTMREIGFLRTGREAHGLAISRDTTKLYVTNRLSGTISVIDFASRRVVATWHVGYSPDMITLSPDGRQLWTSDRFDGRVTEVDTTNGHIIRVIKVDGAPHGLTYFPQPGQISIGHNGVYR
jgi:YVTN family beta-propeller protein